MYSGWLRPRPLDACCVPIADSSFPGICCCLEAMASSRRGLLFAFGFRCTGLELASTLLCVALMKNRSWEYAVRLRCLLWGQGSPDEDSERWVQRDEHELTCYPTRHYTRVDLLLAYEFEVNNQSRLMSLSLQCQIRDECAMLYRDSTPYWRFVQQSSNRGLNTRDRE